MSAAPALAERTPEPGTSGGMHLFCSVDISDWGDPSKTHGTADFSDWELDRVVAINDHLDVAVMLRDTLSGNSCGFVRLMSRDGYSTTQGMWHQIVGEYGEYTTIEDINDAGTAVGWYEHSVALLDTGFTWLFNAGPIRTDFFNGPLDHGGRIYGINNAGDLGGYRVQPSPLGPVAQIDGGTGWINLPTMLGWTTDGVLGISERRNGSTTEVFLVGQAENYSSEAIRGVSWDHDDSVHWLMVGSHGQDIRPVAVSADNLVAGFVDDGGSSPEGAYLWIPTGSQHTTWDVIAFNSTNYAHLDADYFTDVQALDMNERGEVVLATADSGGLWVWDGTFTNPAPANVHFLPVHWMMAYPPDAADGTFRPEAINENGVMAGTAEDEADPEDPLRLLLAFPYDADNDNTPDYRERVAEVAGSDQIEGNDWIPGHDRQYRMGIYSMGNPNGPGNESLSIEHVSLARIFTTTPAIEDFWDEKQPYIPAAINAFGWRVSGTNSEVMLWVRDPADPENIDSNQGTDRVVLPEDYDSQGALLNAFRCISHSGARSIDYIQLGNEAFTDGAPGALYFDHVAFTDPSTIFTGTFGEITELEHVKQACSLYGEWLEQMANAVREGACYAGRPIRIVTPSPLLGNLIPAAQRDPIGGTNPWNTNPGGIVCHYVLKVYAKWSDFQDMHLHWDGTEGDGSGYGGPPGPDYLLWLVFDNWLFDDTSSPTNWLHVDDSFPERMSCTEFGPKGSEDWFLEEDEEAEKYLVPIEPGNLPEEPDFDVYLRDTWIEHPTFSPNNADPGCGIPELSSALHDREFASLVNGPTKLSVHFGLYGNYLGIYKGTGDPAKLFFPSAVQQLGIHRGFMNNDDKFSTAIHALIAETSPPDPGELYQKRITGFAPVHEEFILGSCSQ